MGRRGKEPDLDTRHGRLRWARMQSFETAAAFCRAHDLEEPAYRHHENGQRQLTIDQARKYGRLLGTDGNWIYDGPGAVHLGVVSANGPAAHRPLSPQPQPKWTAAEGDPLDHPRMVSMVTRRPYKNAIVELRKERGLSQAELARRLGTSPQQMAKLENGQRRLSQDWLERLKAVLACSSDELLHGLGGGSPPRSDRIILQELKRIGENLARHGELLEQLVAEVARLTEPYIRQPPAHDGRMARKEPSPRLAAHASDQARRIYAHLTSRGLTINGWCDRAGVPRAVLRNLFAGRSRNLDTKTLCALASVSELDFSSLLRDAPEQEPEKNPAGEDKSYS